MALNVAKFFKNGRHTSRHLKSVGALINQHIKEEPRLALRNYTGPRNIDKNNDHWTKLTQDPVKRMIHNTVTLEQSVKGNKIIPKCPGASDMIKRGPTTPCGPCKDPCDLGRKRKKGPCAPQKKDICAAYFPSRIKVQTGCRNPCGPRKDLCPRADPCGPKKNPCASVPKKKCVPDPCTPKKETCKPCPPPQKICDPCAPSKKGPCG